MIVAGLVVVPISKRFSPRVVVPGALALSIASYITIAAVAGTDSLVATIGAFVALGIGIGMAETVSNELILSSAPPEKAGAASAVSETAYELGAVLGTAVLGGLLTAMYRAGLVLPAELPAADAAAARETLAGAMHTADSLGGAMGAAVRDAASHAFDSGVTVTALIGAALVAVAAVVAAFTLGRAR
jgi:DHA2 family multidrug resistance protein-like MFS transporter